MSKYPDGIYIKKPEMRKTYEKELIKKYDIENDHNIQKELTELENLASSINRAAHRCDIDSTFLSNISKIGGIYRKYTEFVDLLKGSPSSKRFSSAITKARNAENVFIRDCECKYRKKIY